MEASTDTGNTMWYNSAYFDEPDSPHPIMQPHGVAPEFEQGEPALAYNQAQFQAFMVLIVSLPSILTNSVFGLDGNKPIDGATLLGSYTEMAEMVDQAVEDGYEQALAQVEGIITAGGYDYGLSMDALTNYAYSSAGYDVCYILAAYSASMEQKGISKADMERKLTCACNSMSIIVQESYILELSPQGGFGQARCHGAQGVGGRGKRSMQISR